MVPSRLLKFREDKLERWIVDRRNQFVLDEEVSWRVMGSSVRRHSSRAVNPVLQKSLETKMRG